MVIKAVGPSQSAVNGTDISDAALLPQYKELIREQDRRLKDLEDTVSKLTEERNELAISLDRITNENAVLKAMSQVFKEKVYFLHPLSNIIYKFYLHLAYI